jgi:hypothetical protein
VNPLLDMMSSAHKKRAPASAGLYQRKSVISLEPASAMLLRGHRMWSTFAELSDHPCSVFRFTSDSHRALGVMALWVRARAAPDQSFLKLQPFVGRHGRFLAFRRQILYGRITACFRTCRGDSARACIIDEPVDIAQPPSET